MLELDDLAIKMADALLEMQAAQEDRNVADARYAKAQAESSRCNEAMREHFFKLVDKHRNKVQ